MRTGSYKRELPTRKSTKNNSKHFLHVSIRKAYAYTTVTCFLICNTYPPVYLTKANHIFSRGKEKEKKRISLEDQQRHLEEKERELQKIQHQIAANMNSTVCVN